MCNAYEQYLCAMPVCNSHVQYAAIPMSRVGQSGIRIYTAYIYTPYIYGRIFVEATVSVSV